jgi:hypothetical protein
MHIMKCVRLGLNLNGDIEMGANLLRPDNIMIVYMTKNAGNDLTKSTKCNLFVNYCILIRL